MTDHFITEFGHRIDFVPGYFERNRFYADFALRDDAGKPYEADPKYQGFQMPPHMPAKDWVLFSSLVYFLERNGLLKSWRRGIDLGGAEGTVIRLFKAAGLLSHATNLDIIDHSKIADDRYFADFIARLVDLRNFGADAEQVSRAIDWAKIHLDFLGGSTTLSGLASNFPGSSALDQAFIISAYDTPGTYDLVVANALLEFVDLDRMLPKIRSIMSADGLFVGCFNAAWSPITHAGLVGDFPYLHSRLTLADTRRYLSATRPAQLKNLEARYDYYHAGKHRPSLSQWLALTRSHGLRCIAFERISPKRSARYAETAAQLFQADWFNHEDVLRDAHYLNPTVTVDDLTTTAYRMAFAAI